MENEVFNKLGPMKSVVEDGGEKVDESVTTEVYTTATDLLLYVLPHNTTAEG